MAAVLSFFVAAAPGLAFGAVVWLIARAEDRASRRRAKERYRVALEAVKQNNAICP